MGFSKFWVCKIVCIAREKKRDYGIISEEGRGRESTGRRRRRRGRRRKRDE